MARITVTRAEEPLDGLMAHGLPLRSNNSTIIPCREDTVKHCAHHNAPGFWTWFATVHEHRAVALRSGLVDEVIVEWPE